MRVEGKSMAGKRKVTLSSPLHSHFKDFFMIPTINMNPKCSPQSEVKEEGRGKEDSLASSSLRVVCVSNP